MNFILLYLEKKKLFSCQLLLFRSELTCTVMFPRFLWFLFNYRIAYLFILFPRVDDVVLRVL